MKFIVVVKKTFRYSNVFFYNHLCRNTVIRNIIMESGINGFPHRYNGNFNFKKTLTFR